VGFLQRIIENRTVLQEVMAVSLRRSRTAGATSNLMGIAGLGFAWYLLPGVLMLPGMLVWEMERWQYDTVVTWAHLVSTVIIVSWYIRITEENVRPLVANRIDGRMVASSVVTGVMLAAAGELLWGASVGEDVTIIALRFEPVVNVGVVALFIGAVVLTPLVQEAFFRGVVQDHAKTSLSAGGAILVSGTVFALLYGSLFYIGNPLPVAVTMVFLFPQGCLLGYLYQRHDTILTPAIAHTVVNLYAFSPLLI
jgi:membrane protease YdiL (CAAX protease family)